MDGAVSCDAVVQGSRSAQEQHVMSPRTSTAANVGLRMQCNYFKWIKAPDAAYPNTQRFDSEAETRDVLHNQRPERLTKGPFACRHRAITPLAAESLNDSPHCHTARAWANVAGTTYEGLKSKGPAFSIIASFPDNFFSEEHTFSVTCSTNDIQAFLNPYHVHRHRYN
jgi:hypothetical protein